LQPELQPWGVYRIGSFLPETFEEGDEVRRLGDLNPGGAVNPNRISSAAP
jgi:hypothetical protein